jgi:hypothetical protein
MRLNKAMMRVTQFNSIVLDTISSNKTQMCFDEITIDYDLLEERWYALERIGYTDTLPYIYGILGKGSCLNEANSIFIKKQLRRVFR